MGKVNESPFKLEQRELCFLLVSSSPLFPAFHNALYPRAKSAQTGITTQHQHKSNPHAGFPVVSSAGTASCLVFHFVL